MPRKLELTWQPGGDGRTGRWRKKFRNKIYYFDGGRGKSDRKAYQEAVEEWRKLRGQLEESDEKPHEQEYRQAIEEWTAALNWSIAHEDQETAQRARGKIRELERRLAAPKPRALQYGDRFFDTFTFASDALDDVIRELGLGPKPVDPNSPTVFDPRKLPPRSRLFTALDVDEKVWEDRIANQMKTSDDADQTVGGNAKRFLERKRSQVDLGNLSAGRYDNLVAAVNAFRDFAGSANPVQAVTSRLLEDYHTELANRVQTGDYGHAYARDRMDIARQFIHWLWRSGTLHELPRNIKDPDLRFSVPTGQVVTFTVAEVKKLIGESTDLMKCCILLAINTGMTQSDMASLKQDELNLEAGTITRRRTKTRKFENAPVVTYALWPRTRKLLTQLRATEGELVLLNSKGRPLKVETLNEDGKLKKIDNIGREFSRLLTRLKMPRRGFKHLRKTSATLLEDSEFADVVDLFLGHSPRRIAQKHYTGTPQQRLAAALEWLRKQFN